MHQPSFILAVLAAAGGLAWAQTAFASDAFDDHGSR